ncbi:MAG: 30S ribosomal protein S8e [Candidatus Methanofastidiosa archaeon]|nr:30S ribosomal protein S8e [Candidatus Methanofastidiosa archaeon]
MGFWQGKSKRKSTGGRLRLACKKKKREMGSEFIEPRIGEYRKKFSKGFGGHEKIKIKSTEYINVSTSEGSKRAKVQTVLENPANIHYVRRNVLTKGAVVETDIGKARITSRPGQDGVMNAILLE